MEKFAVIDLVTRVCCVSGSQKLDFRKPQTVKKHCLESRRLTLDRVLSKDGSLVPLILLVTLLPFANGLPIRLFRTIVKTSCAGLTIGKQIKIF
jgi:hypothetical protein